MLIHLIELRRRILILAVVFFLFFIIYFLNAGLLFQLVVKPLLKVLPGGSNLIATDITSPLFIPLKLAANVALLSTIPVVLYHIWRFACPGLYQSERRLWFYITLASLILFSLGGFFCFYIVLPFMLKFFVGALPKGVRLMPEMATAIEFIIRMILIFGFSFQIPLICLFLVRVRLIKLAVLKQIRPYFIVAAFTMGMLLTPPDVLSQLMLAIPLCALYELGILLAYYLQPMAGKKINSGS